MIGKRIQEIRLEKGLSLTELAERAGVAKSYLSYIERNLQTNPSVQFLEKITAVLEVDIHYLLNSEEGDTTIDHEWMSLVRKAIDAGISKEQFQEFQEFIQFNRWRENRKGKNE
ncbi:helix-turn-helix domain-containing protein [Brevibacillus sp. B_LB10_24]|uniref:helix-turn-helix domain-containing protein n=1 Tax=Brevibacillus sp. B_LB10_24 TaxID=3380645 RepID=UPI0038BDD1D2